MGFRSAPLADLRPRDLLPTSQPTAAMWASAPTIDIDANDREETQTFCNPIFARLPEQDASPIGYLRSDEPGLRQPETAIELSRIAAAAPRT
jgi:hypothetical protein